MGAVKHRTAEAVFRAAAAREHKGLERWLRENGIVEPTPTRGRALVELLEEEWEADADLAVWAAPLRRDE